MTSRAGFGFHKQGFCNVRLGTIALVFNLLPVTVIGQTVHIVRDLPQYTCAMLTLTPEQAKDPAIKIPLYAGPSRSERILAYANTPMAVRNITHPRNSFVEVLFSTGRTMWIEAGSVEPYRNLIVPDTQCVPAEMSNGLIFFDFSPHKH